MSDIAERLRGYNPPDRVDQWPPVCGATLLSIARDIHDGADEIERLRAEVGHWREANRTSLTAGDVLKDEVARLTAERDDAQHAALNFGDDLRLWSIDEIVSYLEQRAEACFNRDQCSTAPTELSYCATQKAVAELKAALAERDALLARVEAAEKDAARYRWLRNESLHRLIRGPICIDADTWGEPVMACGKHITLDGATLDAAIDAAMEGGK